MSNGYSRSYRVVVADARLLLERLFINIAQATSVRLSVSPCPKIRATPRSKNIVRARLQQSRNAYRDPSGSAMMNEGASMAAKRVGGSAD
jgi:hypothetical protein